MGKRTYGTGSLRVVGNSWVGSWYGPDGRRVKRTVGPVRPAGTRDGLTKAQAEKALQRLREEEDALVATHRIAMAEAGVEHVMRLELKGRKKSHRLTVASDLRNHIVPFFGDKELSRITPYDIERYVRVKRATLSLKTIRNHLNHVHAIFELGLRRDWRLSNPVCAAPGSPDTSLVDRRRS